MIPETNLTYRLVSTNLGVVSNVAFNIFPPDDWVVVIRFEELRNVFGPCLDGMKPILAKDAVQVSLDSNNGGGGKVVTEDPERRDGLRTDFRVPKCCG